MRKRKCSLYREKHCMLVTAKGDIIFCKLTRRLAEATKAPSPPHSPLTTRRTFHLVKRPRSMSRSLPCPSASRDVWVSAALPARPIHLVTTFNVSQQTTKRGLNSRIRTADMERRHEGTRQLKRFSDSTSWTVLISPSYLLCRFRSGRQQQTHYA